jgi:hypothetical protein
MTGAIMNRALLSLHQVVITVVLLIMAALYGAPRCKHKHLPTSTPTHWAAR